MSSEAGIKNFQLIELDDEDICKYCNKSLVDHDFDLDLVDFNKTNYKCFYHYDTKGYEIFGTVYIDDIDKSYSIWKNSNFKCDIAKYFLDDFAERLYNRWEDDGWLFVFKCIYFLDEITSTKNKNLKKWFFNKFIIYNFEDKKIDSLFNYIFDKKRKYTIDELKYCLEMLKAYLESDDYPDLQNIEYFIDTCNHIKDNKPDLIEWYKFYIKVVGNNILVNNPMDKDMETIKNILLEKLDIQLIEDSK